VTKEELIELITNLHPEDTKGDPKIQKEN